MAQPGLDRICFIIILVRLLIVFETSAIERKVAQFIVSTYLKLSAFRFSAVHVRVHNSLGGVLTAKEFVGRKDFGLIDTLAWTAKRLDDQC